jgi:TrmH family RNA methyltransferase
MVVKNQIKLIKSLQQKKYRTQHSLFVAEGIKTVNELLKSNIVPHEIYCTEPSILKGYNGSTERISELELKRMSSLRKPNGVLGVFQIPHPEPIDFSDWIVVLDDVGDPGNLGAIIRLCDWFGIRHLVCSKNTVDCYNPKVLQATMGSIARVNIVYEDLVKVTRESKLPTYGTFMGGDSIYTENLPDAGILVMGNEANGISKEIEGLCHKKIRIPQFGQQSTESLNVATATAILLNEIRRE